MAEYTFLSNADRRGDFLYFRNNNSGEVEKNFSNGSGFECLSIFKRLGLIDNEEYKGIVLPDTDEDILAVFKLCIDVLDKYSDKSVYAQKKLVVNNLEWMDYLLAVVEDINQSVKQENFEQVEVYLKDVLFSITIEVHTRIGFIEFDIEQELEQNNVYHIENMIWRKRRDYRDGE